MGIKEAIKAGVRTIEHASYMDEECVELILKRGNDICTVPTFAVAYSLVSELSGPVVPEFKSKTEDGIAHMAQGIHLCQAAGITIGFGTDLDMENAAKYPGIEFQARASYGVDNETILKQATIESAKILRMDDKLGAGYSEAEIRAVLAGEKQHTPRKKSIVQPEPPKVNLLVDIQAKLQAGKGAGYVRWAKVFNLKQMAQTVNFLTEHHLLDYTELEEKAVAATAHHNELSAQIKATEKRMAEIAVLRTHIVNYAKTRETYVAYRKAGYSRKFREEHEQEILLHQAAKNAFDEMGVKKLPKVKDLQSEYAKLLEEKKKTYAEYRRSREEMRELLTAKANVDRLLKMDEEQKKEQEKDHGQR